MLSAAGLFTRGRMEAHGRTVDDGMWSGATSKAQLLVESIWHFNTESPSVIMNVDFMAFNSLIPIIS
jgi:hypothetical protein